MTGIPYRTDENPPYPALTIALSYAGEERRCEGTIDTGASCTCVPQRMLDAVEAAAGNEILIRGFDGKPQVACTYYVRVEVLDVNWPGGVPNRFDELEVCAIQEPRDGSPAKVLIGRDLLRNWSLLLEGPRETLHIQS